MSCLNFEGKIGIFYLVAWSGERKLAPLDFARRFAESYARFSAGVNHRLILILSRNQNEVQIAELDSLFGGTAPSVFPVSGIDYDIGMYRSALAATNFELYCFLNSYSVILAPGWLKSLSDCALNPRVGLVGATASYQSIFSDAVTKLSPRRQSLGQLSSGVSVAVKCVAHFPPFPNPHIRTNAFMIRKDVFQRICWPRNPSRMETFRFESGRRSLTRQVLKMGLDAMIVGCDGRPYSVSEWPSSGTFRQNEQDNVLVADNHTIDYDSASSERRRQLAAAAWGVHSLR
jgi:hypothetical protein